MGMFVQGERGCLPTSPPLHLSRLEQHGLSYLWHIFLIPRGVWSGEGSCRALPGSLGESGRETYLWPPTPRDL